MVSLIHLSIIAIGVLIAFTIYVIVIEKNSTPPNKVWITRHMMGCDVDPFVRYLQTNNIVIFDIKTEFKKEFAQLCEGCNCGTGIFKSFLISKKDALEFQNST